MGPQMSTHDLSDDIIFRGAVVALSELRCMASDHPLYGAYRAAARAWVNEAQARLTPTESTEIVSKAQEVDKGGGHPLRTTADMIAADMYAQQGFH